MNFQNLTSDNIDLYCVKHYDNPQCLSFDDYHNDMRRFKYIKRLLNQYRNNNILKIRLLLNHIIMVYNLFDQEAATRILFFKTPPEDWDILKTLLVFLNRLPRSIEGINNSTINTLEIKNNQAIVNMLKDI